MAKKRRCSAVTKAGRPCRAWAASGTDPPLCSAHRGPIGAPALNQNARTHGVYRQQTQNPDQPIGGLEGVIDATLARFQDLDKYIDEHWDDLSADEVVKLVNLLGQLASRLGRLLRDHRAIVGDAGDGIAGAIAQALDEVGTQLGVSL